MIIHFPLILYYLVLISKEEFKGQNLKYFLKFLVHIVKLLYKRKMNCPTLICMRIYTYKSDTTSTF